MQIIAIVRTKLMVGHYDTYDAINKLTICAGKKLCFDAKTNFLARFVASRAGGLNVSPV